MTPPDTRTEKDSMGELPVPADALYGATTQRAVLNFPISGYRFSRSFLRALGLVKSAAAKANQELGKITAEQAGYIQGAAEEVIDGKLDSHFPIDIFQTGSGTSTNMNANEVIANRASQMAEQPIGSKKPVHPNDHVNMGQSSNDVIPTAMHVAAAETLQNDLLPALEELGEALAAKSREFWDIIKIGRTHLMDATPVRLGQEFAGYARQARLGAERIKSALRAVEELPLGGTAVGTGLNCHPDFPRLAIGHLSARTKVTFREAADHFEAQSAKDGLVEASGLVKATATGLFKVANDIRWLSSGPRCGFGEIALPATQPGSSIMPGKVNPVMCEALMQVCAQVFGGDATITWAAAAGSSFELNVMMPVLAHHFLENTRILANAVRVFTDRCVRGITANEARCNELVEYSMAMVTSLAPIIGYDRAAEIAKESGKTGKTVREICQEQHVLPEAELNAALDPVEMTKPGGEGAAGG